MWEGRPGVALGWPVRASPKPPHLCSSGHVCGRHSPGRTRGLGTQTPQGWAHLSLHPVTFQAGPGLLSRPQRRGWSPGCPRGRLPQKGRQSVLRTFRLRFPLGRVPLPPGRNCSRNLSETRSSQQHERRCSGPTSARSGARLPAVGVTVLKGHRSVDGVQLSRPAVQPCVCLDWRHFGRHSVNARAPEP